ncbi:MAG: carboxypeptidase M32, partial [Candidatus Hydrogenedentota bacterium]
MPAIDDLEELRRKLGEISDIHNAIALLQWDQETYMPPKGAEARSFQLATLSALKHRLLTTESMGNLLHDLRSKSDPLDLADAELVEIAWYDYDRATKLPEDFVHTFAAEQSKALEVWTKARQTSDFSLFRPNLEVLVQLARQKAEYFGYEESPYDALIEEFERGMTSAELKRIFNGLAPKQSGLVERIVQAGRPDLPWLTGTWEESAQWDFSLEVLRDMGYDFEAGRQDKSVHPFSTYFDTRDVRITTRLSEKALFSSLMSSIHEGGHALYMQGHADRDRRTLLCDAPSLGMHESQSRMWENMIGRSLPFWRHYLPVLRGYFPGRLDQVAPEDIYAAVNIVEPSLIRVEADECTYNLHIIIRFELEAALIEGELAVDDIPEAWNAKVKDYLGLDVPDDAHGCLQDIHWSHGAFGYFPTYALGNLYAAQFFDTMIEQIPDLWEKVTAADFAPILGWLREHIHVHGRRKPAPELVRDVTGRDLSP